MKRHQEHKITSRCAFSGQPSELDLCDLASELSGFFALKRDYHFHVVRLHALFRCYSLIRPTLNNPGTAFLVALAATSSG
jgi:hypothetical protein